MLQYFILALVAAASANVYRNGYCPDVTPVENFDWSTYKGIWWEYAKYPNTVEKIGKCAWAEYIPHGDGVKVRNVHIIDGKEYAIDGFARAAGARNIGKIYHRLTYGGVTKENLLNVLATDGENYIIGHHCRFDKEQNDNQELLWVLTKSQNPDAKVKSAIEDFIRTSTVVDTEKLVYSDFSADACNISKQEL